MNLLFHYTHHMVRVTKVKRVATHPLTLKISPVVSLITIWALFTRAAFSEKVSFAIWLDNEEYFSPIMSRMSNLLSLHQWPYWLDNFLGGVKFYDNPQMTPYYPFYFLYLDRFNTPAESLRTVHLVTLFHLLIFLLTSYYLLRVLGISRIISIAAATLIVFNQNTYQLCTWLTIIATLAWTPLAIAGIVLIVKKKSRRSFIVFHGAIWLIMVASPSQNFILTIFLSILFFVFLMNQIPTKLRWDEFKQISKAGKYPTIFFIALALPIYVPILLGWSQYIRWVGNFPPVIGFQKIPYSAFLDEQLSKSELSNLFLKVPPVHPGADIYVGAFILLSVIFGSFLMWKSKIYRFFLIIAVYSLISSFGSNFGLAQFNYVIPGLSLIRQPSRFLAIFHLSLYICAAFVFDRLRMTQYEYFNAKRKEKSASGKSVKHIRQSIAGFSITAIIVLNQYNTVPLNPPSVDTRDYKVQGIDFLDKAFEKITESDPTSEFRVAFLGKADPQRSSMFASYHGIRTVTAYFNPAPLEQFQNTYFYDLLPASFMNDLGIKYIICGDCEKYQLPIDFKHRRLFRFLLTEGSYDIYVNDNAAPAVAFATQVTDTFSTFPEAMGKVEDTMIAQVENGILLEESEKLGSLPNANCDKRNYSRNGQVITIKYYCTGASYLETNEYFSRNWHADINGQGIKIFKINGSLLGVVASPGLNTLTLRYHPNFVSYLWYFSMGILTLTLFLISSRRIKLFLQR